jgi:hypothetical protein
LNGTSKGIQDKIQERRRKLLLDDVPFSIKKHLAGPYEKREAVSEDRSATVTRPTWTPPVQPRLREENTSASALTAPGPPVRSGPQLERGMAVRNGSGAIFNGSRRVLKQGEAPEGAEEVTRMRETPVLPRQREAKLKQRRVVGPERVLELQPEQPQRRDHNFHNPPVSAADPHRLPRDEAEIRPFSNDESATKGVRRRISKKREGRTDRPWKRR